MKRALMLFSLVSVLVICSKTARADFEGIQAVISYAGNVVASAKEQVSKAKSLYDSVEQMKTQVTSVVNDAKNVVNEAKNTINTAKEKVEAIKGKAEGIISAGQSKDIGGLKDGLSGLDFGGLRGAFDGSKSDDEMAEAVLDTMVRKKGDNSIANQKELSKALNQKNGSDMANMFAKTMVLRQDLRGEKDETENPETVADAIDLTQKARISAMKRRNRIVNMESTISRFHHAQEIQNIQREDDGEESK